MIGLALAVALGVILVPLVFQLCALVVLIICAPFSIIANEIKLWSNKQ